MRTVKRSFLVLVILLVVFGIWFFSKEPSHDRDWTLDQTILPRAEITDGEVAVFNIRNFEYEDVDEYIPDYYDRTFVLDEIENVYYVVEPFSGYKAAAHTLLSFEFEGDVFVAVSVEIRKREGTSFSAFRGLFREFEIMYVVADERDVVKLRSNHRNDPVYIYPAQTTKENMQALFLSVMRKVNKLYEEPEFYNTLTNNCTTSIVRHVNEISPNRIPWHITTILPENSDRYAYELGLLDVEEGVEFEEIRRAHRINTLAETYADDPEFSLRIRGR